MSDVYEPYLGRGATNIPISNSEIQLYKRNKREWWLKYYLGLTPKQRTVDGPLPLGTRVHNALEVMYANGEDPLDAYMALLDVDRELFDNSSRGTNDTARDKFNSDAELGRLMIDGYVQWVEETGADSNWEIVDVEKEVSYPMLDGRVRLRGKVDMKVRDVIDGARLAVDHKALHVDEQVLTPVGFVRMGDIRVGDEIVSPSGTVEKVLGVYPQGKVPLYSVMFNDGPVIRACADHLWPIQTRYGEEGVVSTLQMAKLLSSQDVFLPPLSTIDLVPETDLPMDPHSFGRRMAECTTSEMYRLATAGYNIKHRSFEDRQALVDGFLSTLTPDMLDMYVFDFYEVVDDLIWLLRSLGRKAYGVDLPDNKYSLTADSYGEHPRRSRVYDIDYWGDGEAVCIEVSGPDKQYITTNFIPTHNTTISFKEYHDTAHMSEQLATYALLERLQNSDDDTPVEGGIYNLLRKVKRSGQSKPPYYERITVRFNETYLKNFWTRLHGTLYDMMRTRDLLDSGVDHQMVAYPTIDRDLTWMSDFYDLYHLLDDGSNAEAWIRDNTEIHDPYARYDDLSTTEDD